MTHAIRTVTAGIVAAVAAVCLLGGCAGGPKSGTPPAAAKAIQPAPAPTPESAQAATAAATAEVVAAERAFANTMATRDFKRFITFLSPDAVFFSGNAVKHGAAEVAEQWAPYFDSPQAPFAWAPDHVEVLASGTLALSTGPVYQKGKLVGRFNSIWRLEAPNTWRIVFDKGEAVCGASP